MRTNKQPASGMTKLLLHADPNNDSVVATVHGQSPDGSKVTLKDQVIEKSRTASTGFDLALELMRNLNFRFLEATDQTVDLQKLIELVEERAVNREASDIYSNSRDILFRRASGSLIKMNLRGNGCGTILSIDPKQEKTVNPTNQGGAEIDVGQFRTPERRSTLITDELDRIAIDQ